jgi:hypothetical protein
MPRSGKLEKATLTEMWPAKNKQLQVQDKDGDRNKAKRVTVQFNPQTLKLSFSNQTAGGDQAGGSSTQFVGQGTTKLSLELWFDVTLPLPSGTPHPKGDVRHLTKEVAYFMTPQEVTIEREKGLVPPGVEFQWGSFLFKGTVDSMDETLELFSEDGKPLRAVMQLSLSKQDLKFEIRDTGGGAGGMAGIAAAGTQPLQMARAGDTVQAAAARAGVSDWKAVAAANGIENPRAVAPGALLNVSGSASGGGSRGVTGTAGGGSVSAGAAAPGITVAGSGSGSSGLAASASLRFTGPSGAPR